MLSYSLTMIKFKQFQASSTAYTMNFMLALLLGLLTALAVLLFIVHTALSPTIPIKGKTNIPSPKFSLPIIGDAWRFIGMKDVQDLWLMIDGSVRELRTKVRVLSLWMGPKLFIAVLDPNLVEGLLNSSKTVMKDPEVYGHFNKITDGMFSRNGKGWMNLRRPFDKLMHPQIIANDYSKVMVAKVEMLCEKLAEKCDQGVIDMRDHVKFCALDVVLETVIGVRGNQMEKDIWNFPSTATYVTEIILKMMFKLHYRFDWILNLTKEGKEFRKRVDHAQGIMQGVFAERCRYFEKNGLDPKDPNFIPQCYTDIVMQVGNQENLSEEKTPLMIMDMIEAGFDTSTIALSSFILFMAMHPECQEKAYKEQIDIMGDSLNAPTPLEMSQMNYLWMAYQETLRLAGVPAFVRVLSAEHKIDNFVFPEGAALYFSLLGMSSQPEYWEKPSEFYPEHFLPATVTQRPKGAFLPFSKGARSCPGKNFALTMGKIMLSMLIRRFKFTTKLKLADMKYKYMLMMESELGYPVEVTRRTTVA